ncbi:sodium/nucleoside cotransporter 2-like [Eublepharis macularius]|uniref:Sodium/nucleoside cotransporter n=1 Tax=Eublepharis macularius TaxID=481883 RepID=A0AA97KLS8_EUBMA|nr:sodium/nucleoside cotransporter 2-like [Eublepharis macularius]
MEEIRISPGGAGQGLDTERNPETAEQPLTQGERSAQFNAFLIRICSPLSKACDFCQAHAEILHKIFLGLLIAAYLAYFIAACWLDFQRALGLFVLTCLAIFLMAYNLVQKWWGVHIIQLLSPVGKCFRSTWPWLKWAFYLLIPVSLITLLVLDVSQRKEQLVSLGGFSVLVLALFLCSRHHSAVSWRTVFWGLGLQFLLGVFIIRTKPGFLAFQWLGKQISIFLGYTRAGSSFVFGDRLINESFAFLALPIIVFFSCVTSILYYLGVIQWVIFKISWLLQITMNTSTTESLSVAGNVFLGMTEALLLIHPYLSELTSSEIHAVMAGGFSTIAGSVMGAYISFGVDASSLIAASVMAAPCALAMAKLVYPEVEESKFRNMENVTITAGEERNVIEAASNGAAISVGMVANIAANLIAFLAMLAFINAVLAWLGHMVNVPGLSFELICSYVLVPVAFLLGASWDDAPIVAELLGIKLFLNEFVAYQQLATYKKHRLDGWPEWGRAKKQWISVRAEIISTFALCGFANLGSTGIMLGALTSLVPQRKSEFSSIILWSLLTGTCVSLINACIAGILYVPREDVTDCPALFRTANLSSTSYSIYLCCQGLFSSTSLATDGSFSFSGTWQNQDANATATRLQQCCGHYKAVVCGKP